jgi:[acyl-carrier-protein] S-malonyltransferase
MAGLAFVFSGQGDQRPGMGKDLYDQGGAAARVFDTCERLRPGTIDQCFGASLDELSRTENAQPCLFAMELALAESLREQGISPQAVAGSSLGEMVAATFAGVFTPEDGFSLVCTRGRLMQQAAQRFDTFMAAVVKLDASQVRSLCEQMSDVYPVNFNCPGQTTVAGSSLQQAAFIESVRQAGGRAIPLKVSGAFHSPYMEEAAGAFAKELRLKQAYPANIAMYSNVTGGPYGTIDPVDLLWRQVASPVQWETEVGRMIDDGIDTFVEIGPGHTLTNMIRRISSEVRAVSAAECNVAEL